MSFAPPPGPPPPSTPEGWKAQYDDRYNQWFFVNLHTGKSQWDRPEAPAQKEELHAPPGGPPPSYGDSGSANPSALAAATDKKTLGSNNPYNQPEGGNDTLDSDARLAAQLQAEEDARAQSRSPAVQHGAASDYYSGSSRPQSSTGYQSPQGSTPASEQKRSKGFLSKLMGKSSSSSYGRPPPPVAHQPSYAQQQGGYYGGGYPPQPGYPHQPGYPQQPGYGYPQYPPQGGYYAAGQPPRRSGGMGTAGAAALGVGGGLLGGAMLASAFDDDHGDTVINNYGDDYSGDFGGGGDDFGGDF